MKIIWDPAKAVTNVAAHGVTFAEAATVLEDESALTREDLDVIGEQRFAQRWDLAAKANFWC